MKKYLPNVTLITVDCRHPERSKAGADICQKNFEFGAVKILSHVQDSDPRIVHIDEINNGKIYSEFYIRELYKYVDTELALTYHNDSFIANPEAWTDEYLKYDYIGPPWYHVGNTHVGNGGFAIRSRRLLEYVAKNCDRIGGQFEPEDLWVCETARPHLEKEGMTFAPESLAKRWGIEGGIRGVVWDGQFGWHGINSTDMTKWFDKNPEYKNIFPQKFDDFTQFMRRYPVYDGTWGVLQCKPIQVEHYKKMASGKKNYDCRMDVDLFEIPEIKPGFNIIYKLFRILVSQVGVPTFEKQVSKVEKFNTKEELLRACPEVEITPSFNLPKWKQDLMPILGNRIFPNNQPYTLIRFS